MPNFFGWHGRLVRPCSFYDDPRMVHRFVALSLLLATASCSAQSASPMPTSQTTLFNGWKLTPAGQHVSIPAMCLKMILSPDRSKIAAVCAGAQPGLAIIDIASRQVDQFAPLPASFNGLAFSR